MPTVLDTMPADIPIAWRNAMLVLTGLAAGCHGVSALIAGISIDQEDHDVASRGRALAMLVILTYVGIHLAIAGSPSVLVPSSDLLALLLVIVATWFVGVARESSRGRGIRAWLGRSLRRILILFGLGLAGWIGSGWGFSMRARTAPQWPDAMWIYPLLLASSARMGAAALILIAAYVARPSAPSTIERLERVQAGALILAALALGGQLLMLGQNAVETFGRWPALLIPAFAVPVGWLLPQAVHRLAGARGAVVNALLVLIGECVLRAALAATPAALFSLR